MYIYIYIYIHIYILNVIYIYIYVSVSARIGSTCKKFNELISMLVEKQGLSLQQQWKIYLCCVRPVLVVKHGN